MSPEQRASVVAVMNAAQARIPHNTALGLEVFDFGPREVWMRLPYHPQLVGNPATGVMHGGAISSLVDAACGFAVMIALGKPMAIATLDLRIDFMQPAPPGHPVIAHAVCERITRHVCFVRGTAYVVEGEPIATVAATFAKKAGRAPHAERT